MSGQKHGHRDSNGREKGDDWKPRAYFLLQVQLSLEKRGRYVHHA